MEGEVEFPSLCGIISDEGVGCLFFFFKWSMWIGGGSFLHYLAVLCCFQHF